MCHLYWVSWALWFAAGSLLCPPIGMSHQSVLFAALVAELVIGVAFLLPFLNAVPVSVAVAVYKCMVCVLLVLLVGQA